MHSETKKKLRAVLVGGLVVGVGAAVTLAAWNDSEFAEGTFASGQFNLEGSTTGATEGFAEHPSSDAAAPLTFALNPDNLSPGDSVYAPFAVRLDATTTNDASVAIDAASTGTTTGLTYQLIETTGFGCDAGTTGTDLVPAGTSLGSVSGPAAFDLAKGSAAAAGEAVNLCFVVTADAGLTQDQAAASTWGFTATSKDS